MIKLLFKNKNISSFNFINKFKNENKIKKIGHTGTLDPIAEGLLLVATDNDTKLIPFLLSNYKTYIAKAKLGISTDTYDITGIVTNKIDALPKLNESIVNDAFEILKNKKEQMPPIFSAKKILGEKAYVLARKGQEVKLRSVSVDIKYIKLIELTDDEITFETKVSKGTYIRTMINDLGILLNTYATMTELKRTEIEDLGLSQVDKELNPIDLIDIEKVNLDDYDIQDIKKHGNVKRELPNTCALIYNNKLIAIRSNGRFKLINE